MNSTKENTKSREVDSQPMRFANATLGQHRHVCAFSRRGGGYRCVPLLPFVKEGLARREGVSHCSIKTARRALTATFLSRRRRPFGREEWTIRLHHWLVYLRDGHFDRDQKCLPACRTYWSRASATAPHSPASWATPKWASGDGPG